MSCRGTTFIARESFGRLGIETIDLYQLHASDMHTSVEETLLFLDEAAQVVGARTVEHLRNNLGAAELTLDNEACTPAALAVETMS